MKSNRWTNSILLVAGCSVASFLIGASAHVNGAGGTAGTAGTSGNSPSGTPELKFGRYQMFVTGDPANGFTHTRIFDTASGRFLEAPDEAREPKWVDFVIPANLRIRREREEEFRKHPDKSRLPHLDAP